MKKMDVSLELNTGLPDVAVKEEQEKDPYVLRQWESQIFPGTSSGSLDFAIKPVNDERLCKQQSKGNEFGFPEITVKVEQEEEPCSLHQSEAETSSASSSGFPDIIMKEEEDEEEGHSSHPISIDQSGFPHTVVKTEREEGPQIQEESVESSVGEQSGTDNVEGTEVAAMEKQPVDSSDAASKKGRGVAWQRAETITLLRLWGEEHVQEQLRSSHRNIETFELIAHAMHKRGFNRSAAECRTKTKSLRQQYKYALQENGKTGNSSKTCPHFDLLDSILRGDPSVKALRLSDSHDAPDIAEVLDKTDTTKVVDFMAVKEDPSGHVEDNGEVSNIESSCSSRSSADAFDPAVCNPTATLDPATRLGNIRRRKEKSAKGESLVHAMLRYASRDSREMVEEMRRLAREDNKVFAEMRDTMAQEAVNSERYRGQLLAKIDRNTDIFADLAKEMISLMRRFSEGGVAQGTSIENHTKERRGDRQTGPVAGNLATKRKLGMASCPGVARPKCDSLGSKSQHCLKKRRNFEVNRLSAREGMAFQRREYVVESPSTSDEELNIAVTEEEEEGQCNMSRPRPVASPCLPEKCNHRTAKTLSLS